MDMLYDANYIQHSAKHDVHLTLSKRLTALLSATCFVRRVEYYPRSRTRFAGRIKLIILVLLHEGATLDH
jgi:hypothetical protein